MPKLPITLAAALALAACGAPLAVKPTVSESASGTVTVAYRSGCTLVYGNTGMLLGSGRGCSFEERQDAEGHYRSWRLDHPSKLPA
jgi:hypothetical protein